MAGRQAGQQAGREVGSKGHQFLHLSNFDILHTQ